MPIDAAQTAVLAPAPRQEFQRKSSAKFYDYPVLRPSQYKLWLHSIKLEKDERQKDMRYGQMKVAFRYIVIIDGWENADTEAKREALRKKGHGKMITKRENPVCSPPRDNGSGGTTRASNVYVDLCMLYNDGEPLTDEQMGNDILNDEAKFTQWQAAYNTVAKAESRPTIQELAAASDVSVHAQAVSLFRGDVLARLLNGIEARHPYVYGVLKKWKSANGIEGNDVDQLVSLVPTEELPIDANGAVVQYEFWQLIDERQKNDKGGILCEDCGDELKGWENYKGEWVTDEQSAALSREKHKAVYCGKCIAARKKNNGNPF